MIHHFNHIRLLKTHLIMLLQNHLVLTSVNTNSSQQKDKND